MAESIQRTDSIESSGFPLGFTVRKGSTRPGVIGAAASRDMFKVELRALGGHQKEAVVTEGEAGSMFRNVCDEGALLKGTDLAPFPLGFFSAGLQADIENRFMTLAAARGLRINSLATELMNGYEFNGSFYRGDGKGSADAPRIKLKVSTSASAESVYAVARSALDASPMVAAIRAPLANTFAIYVNGRRRPITTPNPSRAGDASDPLKTWAGVPKPLASAADLPDMIAKLVPAPDGQPVWTTPPDPTATVRRQIEIYGISRWNDGLTESETWGAKPLGSRFGLKSDERPGGDRAPSGLGIAVSGIAHCLTTQLLRYTEVHKMAVRAIRVVQFSPFELAGNAKDGSLRAIAHPFDTHVFLHGDDTDERMERLLAMAQNTCYLHALLHESFEPVLELEVTH